MPAVRHDDGNLWDVQSKGPVPERSAWGASRPLTANWAPARNFTGIEVVTQSKQVFGDPPDQPRANNARVAGIQRPVRHRGEPVGDSQRRLEKQGGAARREVS